MDSQARSVVWRWAVTSAFLVLVLALRARAEKLLLKDGRTIEGRLWRLTGTAEKPKSVPKDGAPEVKSVVMVDDELRRYFIPKRQVQGANPADPGQPLEVFNVPQHVAHYGGRVASVGQLVRIDPFDEFGRRTVQLGSERGVLSVIQGITSITPHWTKVEAIEVVDGKDIVWDMRIATTSIPFETLSKILRRQIDPKKIDQRLKIVRLLVQSQRYPDAEKELTQIVDDFPEQRSQFVPVLRDLRQTYARFALHEINVRRAASQHILVLKLLNEFPTEGVAGETLQAVKQMIDDYKNDLEHGREILEKLKAHINALDDEPIQRRLQDIQQEISAELNVNCLGRMAAYRQFWDDESLSNQEKIALAVSGWIAGANDATRNLNIALSMVKVRNLVRKYLAESGKLNRDRLFAQFAEHEAAKPEKVARILHFLLPPIATPEPAAETPGFYRLDVEVTPGEPAMDYFVQLPLQYDPHRSYPAVLTLHGAGTTPEQQIDWWAGGWHDGMRLGHATRYGYIVIAPAWAKEQQTEYGYSKAEYTAVLDTLRDACGRFSIDTDRVFLSGHSMGGDAAWDIGLAHPDLWAGVIPISAVSDKYCHLIWENAQYAPTYTVWGELDGGKREKNATDLDRYMTKGYNVTVAEFQGRGHEHFSDEILKIFDWMNRYQRDPFPKQFNCLSLRPWDDKFWWVELDGFSEKTLVEPDDWPPQRGTRPAKTRGQVNANNGISVTSGASKATIWLSPELIDFKSKSGVAFNGARAKLNGGYVEPDLSVLLEDARTRADRFHPFWAKVELPNGRANMAGKKQRPAKTVDDGDG